MLRVALFVEGSTGSRSRRHDAFQGIWQHELPTALHLRRIDRVFPISKKHLVAMDPSCPPMSGAGEPLDALMARKLASDPFDAAVIAWDLVPEWASASPGSCRWHETQQLYRCLAASRHLPMGWSTWAARKDAELSSRQHPQERLTPPRLERCATLAICMEPDFEGLLVASESGVRRALGVRGRPVKGWPTRWRDPGVTRPEIDLLQAALLAARKLTPLPAPLRRIRGDLWTAKHEWGEYLLRTLFRDPQSRAALEDHSIAQRLRELLG